MEENLRIKKLYKFGKQLIVNEDYRVYKLKYCNFYFFKGHNSDMRF